MSQSVNSLKMEALIVYGFAPAPISQSISVDKEK
jgi:hypothetical protein